MSEDRLSLQGRREEIIEGLRQLDTHIKQVLKLDQKVLEIAQDLYQQKSLLSWVVVTTLPLVWKER